jgi:hypothetical protein
MTRTNIEWVFRPEPSARRNPGLKIETWATQPKSGICSLIFDRGIMGLRPGLRPTQGYEKRLLFSNYSPWKHCPPLCHPDRSAAQWRDLRFFPGKL